METREDNLEPSENGKTSSESRSARPSGSRRPPILTPEVQLPSDANTSFGEMAKALPDMIQKARGFYARHPTLVKTLGTVFAAAIARRFFRGRPRLF